MNILITGPAGSGKTTQARMLSEQLHLKLIKTGELVRGKSQERSDTGELLRMVLQTGQLAPDHLVANLVGEKIQQEKSADGFIFDGYPRRLSQIKTFDPHFDKVIYIKISDAKVIKRLTKRGRMDDEPEVIKERLKIYHQETQPVLDYYKKLGKLVEVDGDGTEKEVKERIEEHLKL